MGIINIVLIQSNEIYLFYFQVEFEGGKNESNRNRTENFLRYNFERSLFNAGN